MEIIIPIGPSDKLEWVKKSVESALQQKAKVIIYDNSERKDLQEFFESIKSKIVYVKEKRMKKVNMARLRNKMLELADEDYVIFLDSDVIINNAEKIMEKLRNGISYTWMHYAYHEEDINKPLKVGENNPNLGCAGLNVNVIKKIGGFDERYERSEDVWLYSKLKKLGYKVEPTEGRCLHLNKTHAREDFKSAIKEARRNLWRGKYEVMLIFDGLADISFLSGYLYYGSYYVLGILSAFIPYFLPLYIPLVGYGIYYYGGIKKYFYNLIPGLSLALSLPYGLAYNLLRGKRQGN